MTAMLAASIVDALLGLALAPTDQEPNNRVSLEGLTLGSREDGALEIGLRRLEASSFRLASGPLVLEIGQLVLHRLVAVVRMEAGKPRLCTLEAASAEVSGVKVHGPLVLTPPAAQAPHPVHAGASAATSGPGAPGQPAAGAWCLAPLAAADGRIRAEILDAHLLFDADVTVTIRQGQVDFNQATVEHVGPDSRMGVSRLGLYVDAPNGRSYLYQFSSAPVAGVEYERRGALLGAWVTDRGRLRLQDFGEALLRQSPGGHGLGFTEQARLLFERTAVSGDVQLGDGSFAAPGVQVELLGRAQGRNAVRLHSQAVGRGFTLEMASFSARHAAWGSSDRQARCDEMTGTLMLRLFVDAAQWRLAFDLASMKISGLRLHLDGAR